MTEKKNFVFLNDFFERAKFNNPKMTIRYHYGYCSFCDYGRCINETHIYKFNDEPDIEYIQCDGCQRRYNNLKREHMLKMKGQGLPKEWENEYKRYWKSDQKEYDEHNKIFWKWIEDQKFEKIIIEEESFSQFVTLIA